jgi:hypothetical protein
MGPVREFRPILLQEIGGFIGEATFCIEKGRSVNGRRFRAGRADKKDHGGGVQELVLHAEAGLALPWQHWDVCSAHLCVFVTKNRFFDYDYSFLRRILRAERKLIFFFLGLVLSIDSGKL